MSAGSHGILVHLGTLARYTLRACYHGEGIYFDERAARGDPGPGHQGTYESLGFRWDRLRNAPTANIRISRKCATRRGSPGASPGDPTTVPGRRRKSDVNLHPQGLPLGVHTTARVVGGRIQGRTLVCPLATLFQDREARQWGVYLAIPTSPKEPGLGLNVATTAYPPNTGGSAVVNMNIRYARRAYYI